MKPSLVLELRRGDKAKAANRQAVVDSATRVRAILKRASRVSRRGSMVAVKFTTAGEAETFTQLARDACSPRSKRPGAK